MRLTAATAVLALGVVAPGIAPAQAWSPGEPDEAFGESGVATWGASTELSQAFGVALEGGTGKIIVVGQAHETTDDAYAARFIATGDPDLLFANPSFQWRIGGDDDVTFFAVSPGTGRFMLGAGEWEATPGDRDFFVAEFIDGAYSGGFGGVTSDLGGDDVARDVVRQPDGKVVVAGSSVADGQRRGAVVRYTAAGDLDTTFSDDGAFVAGNADFNSVLVLGSGKVLAVGTDWRDPADPELLVVRLHPDGTLDKTFGKAGRASIHVSNGTDTGAALARQQDGALVIAGNAKAPGKDYRALLTRLSPAGKVDITYGGGGILVSTFGSPAAAFNDVVVDGEGRAVAVGYRSGPGPTDAGMLVARFTPTGAPDKGFGPGGLRILEHTPRLGANFSSGNDVLVDGAGDIVVAGIRPSATTTTSALWRLHGVAGTEPTDPVFALPNGISSSARAAQITAISGIAGGFGLTSVDLAVTKVDKALLRDKHQCLWMKSAAATFGRYAATKSGGKFRCDAPKKRLRPVGLTDWDLLLTGRLAPGRYVFYARAHDDTGHESSWRFVRIQLDR